ncbi:hypothetical protein Peur_060063 [Populus x canadensis]
MGQTQQRNVYYNWWMQETNHLGKIEKSCINIHVRSIKSESDNGHGIPTLILGQEEMMEIPPALSRRIKYTPPILIEAPTEEQLAISSCFESLHEHLV